MAKLSVYNIEGNQVGEIELNDAEITAAAGCGFVEIRVGSECGANDAGATVAVFYGQVR